MTDFPLTITVVTTISIVLLISGVSSRLQTLPIDIVTAAISLVLLFADSAHRYQSEHPTLVSPYMPHIAFFICAVSFVITFVAIGIHLAAESERRKLIAQGARYGSFYSEFGYCISLLLGTSFIVMSFLVVSSPEAILDKSNSPGGELFKIADKISQRHDVYVLMKLALSAYLLAIVMRYGRVITDPLRKMLGKRV